MSLQLVVDNWTCQSVPRTVEQNTAFVQKSATIYDVTCQLASSERVCRVGMGVVVLSFHLLPLSADCSERGRAVIYHLWIIGRDNVTGEGTQLFSKKLVLCARGVGWMYEGVVENLLLLATCTSLSSLRPSGWVAEKFRLAPHSNHPIVPSVCLSACLC